VHHLGGLRGTSPLQLCVGRSAGDSSVRLATVVTCNSSFHESAVHTWGGQKIDVSFLCPSSVSASVGAGADSRGTQQQPCRPLPQLAGCRHQCWGGQAVRQCNWGAALDCSSGQRRVRLVWMRLCLPPIYRWPACGPSATADCTLQQRFAGTHEMQPTALRDNNLTRLAKHASSGPTDRGFCCACLLRPSCICPGVFPA
jgi:hypothetical protein